MIPRIEGWHWQVRTDCIVLAAPEIERGVIRYVEKLRPLLRLSDLLARHTSSIDPSAAFDVDVERVVTNEGEYGAVARLDCTVAGRRVRAALGFVFVEDRYALVEGIAAARYGEALTTTVRDLVTADRQYICARRRRYLYQAPPWPAVALGTATAHFLSPGFPRDPTRISVYPALPLMADETPLIDLQRGLGEDLVSHAAGPAAGFVVLARQPATSVVTKSALHGTRYRLIGRWNDERPVEREIALVRDARFAYAAELVVDATRKHTADMARTYFEDLVQSIEPIPPPHPAPRPSVAAFGHWAD